LPDNGGSVALASGEEQPRTGAHARMAEVRERAQVDRRRADECEAESLEKELAPLEALLVEVRARLPSSTGSGRLRAWLARALSSEAC